jgi:hypothetical protein
MSDEPFEGYFGGIDRSAHRRHSVIGLKRTCMEPPFERTIQSRTS